MNIRISYYTLLITFFSMLLYSCSDDIAGFKISGKVAGGKGKTIFLAFENKIDSIIIDSDNEFTFKGSLEEPDFCNLYLDRLNPILLFIDSLNNIQIQIETDAEKFATNYTIKGSKTSEQIKELQAKLYTTFVNVKNLYNNTVGYKDSSKTDSVHTLFVKKSNELVNQHRQQILAFIKKNPTSFACLPAIYQAFDSRTPVFTYEMDAPYYLLIDSALMKTHPNSKHTKEFHSQLIILQKKYQDEHQQQNQLNLKKNDLAPDFTLPTNKGGVFTLSQLHGKYVLLDFWASWCAPCRAANPTLINVYKQFHSKGLQVVQVSLDNNKNQWLQAIEKDELQPWIHVSDLKYWDSPVAKLYGVQAIPSNFLIDPDGKIIAQNLQGDDLFHTLEQIIATHK